MKYISRRQALSQFAIISSSIAIGLPSFTWAKSPSKNDTLIKNGSLDPYPSDWLPKGIRSRFVDDINGLRMHVLEAGYEEKGRPGILLLHGFPELAYSWRKIMLPLAEQGYHVIAPDQRGYGRTTGWDNSYNTDLHNFSFLNIVRDALGLIYAMGHRKVAVVGHDFGSPIAACCAVARPDVFIKVALMSAPFSGTPVLPFGTANNQMETEANSYDLHAELAKLAPPRKHYQMYYSTREANNNMRRAPQGLKDFLRGYYHSKSADWKGNKPFRLATSSAIEMAKMPAYYIMNYKDGMAETVARFMPSRKEVAANSWLPDEELEIYLQEYQRTGFQGGLNWYRSIGLGGIEMRLFAGRKIEQPGIFISGASDWGIYQSPGALERMQEQAFKDFRGVHLLSGAGHWVQQEQPKRTAELLINFLQE
jgi:pimeloyl-ACP methyl ester carboxylesterase